MSCVWLKLVFVFVFQKKGWWAKGIQFPSFGMSSYGKYNLQRQWTVELDPSFQSVSEGISKEDLLGQLSYDKTCYCVAGLTCIFFVEVLILSLYC